MTEHPTSTAGVAWLTRRAVEAGSPARTRSGESLGPMMLGVLSTSLGVVALAVVLAGIAGRPIGRWSAPTPTFRTEPSTFTIRDDQGVLKSVPKSFRFVRGPDIYPPAPRSLAAMALGMGLGWAGIALSLGPGRRPSRLSTLGAGLSLASILLTFGWRASHIILG